MAGGRRNPSFRAAAVKHAADQEAKKNCGNNEDSNSHHSSTGIRHMPLPDIPRLSVFAFEMLMCLLSVIALAAHYLNIYRTVFWLPHSHTKYAMNLYLIEPRVVVFIVVSVSRRLVWCVVKTITTTLLHHNHWKTAIPIARGVVVSVLLSVLCYCLSTTSDPLTYIKVLALAYPLVLYVFIFELELTSFLEVIPPAIYSRDDNRSKQGVVRLVQHCCLNTSEGVRHEAEFLASHCYKRVTQVVYQTLVTVYYTTLIPCFFVPNSLHYDVGWLSIHTLFVALTYFMWHLIYCFPARFCDVLHRSVQHLGSWTLQPNSSHNHHHHRTSLPPTPPTGGGGVWQSHVMYPRGSVVRHGREVYRAEATCNCAEPGNAGHARLYTVFHAAWRPIRYFFMLGLASSLGYLFFLASLQQWQQILATAVLLAAHYAAIYVLLRDYLVLRTTYHQETLMGQ